MTKVYVLRYEIAYESGSHMGVFATLELAKKFAQKDYAQDCTGKLKWRDDPEVGFWDAWVGHDLSSWYGIEECEVIGG